MVPCHENGGANRDGQHREDDHERDVIRDRKEPGQGHFNSNKNENDGEAEPEINKPIHQIGQQEVEGTQAENRANVRGINDEGVLSDGEDGRNGIDREDKVHHIDHEQNQSKRGEHEPPIDPRGEMGAAKVLRHRHQFAAHPQEPAAAKIRLLFAEGHPDPGNEQKNAENVEDEVEPRDEGNTQPDHYPAHDQRAQDAPY